MTGRDFLICAERLVQSSAEADLRSAVSRAYYGTFHEALVLLRDNGVRIPKNEQVHMKLVYCFQDCGDANAAKAGEEIVVLRISRRAADYDLDDNRFRDRQQASRQVLRARQILEILRKCRTAPVADEFRAKVRAHAKMLGLSVSG
jgi:uncharacterized protein (UPF0332 family)